MALGGVIREPRGRTGAGRRRVRERRRVPGRRRVDGRRLAGAVGVVGLIALSTVGAAGCAVDSPALDVPAQTGATGALTPAPASGVPSTYTGLGSHTSAFARGHRETSLAAAAKSGKGEIASNIRTSAAGRVTGYVVTFNYQPSLPDAERLASAVGIGDLPADRITVRSAATCLVYASPTMKKLVGMLYTSVVTTPESTTAEVRATPGSSC
jgi:hypothetical protein